MKFPSRNIVVTGAIVFLSLGTLSGAVAARSSVDVNVSIGVPGVVYGPVYEPVYAPQPEVVYVPQPVYYERPVYYSPAYYYYPYPGERWERRYRHGSPYHGGYRHDHRHGRHGGD